MERAPRLPEPRPGMGGPQDRRSAARARARPGAPGARGDARFAPREHPGLRGGAHMIATRLTTLFGLRHPIVLAPMGGVSGGALAAAVSNAGGLGLVGGGYGDPAWLRTELAHVKAHTSKAWGVGFITWSVNRAIVDLALEFRPSAVMLSFGDPAPYVARVKSSGARLICQVQDL